MNAPHTNHAPRRAATRRGLTVALALAAFLTASLLTSVAAKTYGPWAQAMPVEDPTDAGATVNTEFVDGCPIQSPDGMRLYIASNRTGGLGGLDIWVAERTSPGGPFGAPVNLGAPINSDVDDFCPTPVQGKGLFFVSARVVPGACGAGDIYFARLNPAHDAWTGPVNLGCSVNSAAGEAGPSYFEADGQGYLYFSSGPDIMASLEVGDGVFAAATPVAELNSAAGDFRPNVRKDGLEIVFDSNRTGALGGQDLYFATRASVADPWSTPVNGGAAVNTAAASETRGSFSWDGATLYFGRAPGPEGMTDVFVTTR
jgi:hypothetical protein